MYQMHIYTFNEYIDSNEWLTEGRAAENIEAKIVHNSFASMDLAFYQSKKWSNLQIKLLQVLKNTWNMKMTEVLVVFVICSYSLITAFRQRAFIVATPSFIGIDCVDATEPDLSFTRETRILSS